MNSYEDQFVELYIRGGVFYAVFKEGCIITKEVSANMIEKRLAMSKGKVYPILVDGRNVKYWTMDSRNNHMKDHSYDLIEISAMVLNSSIKVIFSFALRLFPAPVKSKFFSSVEDAQAWIGEESKLLNKLPEF